jgi:dienelactone hydrolase
MLLEQIQNYTPAAADDWRTLGKEAKDGVENSLLLARTPFGYQRVAEMYRPEGGGNLAAILYVHWYEPESPTSNRRQFEHEAKELAKEGAVCLLVETLWSDMDFFMKRTQADDPRNSVQESVNLRRALDFLLAQPGIDPARVACVGHDFGGMYGVLAGSVDRRPTHYVIMAATPRFPDWYLYFPKLEGEGRAAFLAQMAELDPITRVPHLAPASILFQFGTDDRHVPRHRAQEFYDAAREPKELKWYEAGHGLNEQAAADRQAWLERHLRLGG